MHGPGEQRATAPNDPFLCHVRELVSQQQYNTWFQTAAVRNGDDQRITLLVPNPFIRDWISNYYAPVLAQAARQAYGEDRAITIDIDPDAPAAPAIEVRDAEPTPAPVAAPTPAVRPRAARSDTFLHDDYTFANFVVGPTNRFAHSAAVSIAESPGSQFNPFFLHGSVGLGKTHLLQAICRQMLVNRPETRILYLSCETFTNHFLQALEHGDINAFRLKYRNVDVLLVDDIHLLANKERTQEEFFHTFNAIYNLGRQIVLSSDATPKDIPTLQERLVSRFKMGLEVQMLPPDFETRVAILRKKARNRDHELPDDVAKFLAEHVSTNIRELEGAVVRLVGLAVLNQQPITLALAEDAMRDGSCPRQSAITITDVIEAVVSYFDVKVSDLQSKRRHQSITNPRQICMYLAREHTNLSLAEIGGYFGGRDHTTVLYAIEKIRSSAEKDPGLRELLRTLSQRIHE